MTGGSRPAFAPPEQLLVADRLPDHPVAFGPGGVVRWQDFRSDVLTLAADLAGAERCLIAAEDAYAVAVGLLAAARAGAEIVLPANLQPGQIQSLAATVDRCLVEGPPPATAARIHRLPPAAADAWLAPARARPARVLEPAPIAVDDVLITLHTAGSTGVPVALTKPLRCLDAEVRTLDGCFDLGCAPILATVPPHHIYGLLFRVLWPLAAGRPLARATIRYPEELTAAIEAQPGALLISSPAFLTRVATVLDLGALSGRLSGVFSSGGPLPPEIGARYNAAGRSALVEVYGSTETGGIAHRRVRAAEPPEPWTRFPGVRLEPGDGPGQFLASSPNIPGAGGFLLADRLEMLADGRFRLLRRADRIVKLEDRRISLDELEQRLETCAEVGAARILPSTAAAGRRALAAVILPSDAGWELLAAAGKPALTSRLKDALRLTVEPVALPRRWRFVRRLPENAQGKTTLEGLSALFLAEGGARTEPDILGCQRQRDQVVLTLRAPRDLVYFDGHFEPLAVLPGVSQLDWAIRYGQRELGFDGRLERLEAVKFHRVISPDTELRLVLGWRAETRRLTFAYEGARTRHSSGRVVFGPAP